MRKSAKDFAWSRSDSSGGFGVAKRSAVSQNFLMSDGVTSSVDWEQLDMIADGYTPDFVEIYREFEVDLPRILSDLRASFDAGDAGRVSRAAHQAKGSAANFGFTAFSRQMAEIELQAKSGDLTGVGEKTDLAEGSFRESVAAVRAERGV